MYTIYVHIFPDGKKYVGATRDDLQKRFGLNGNGYRSKKMRDAINKYGWENIKHKILKDNLDYESAKKYEIHYINKYKSNISEFGYNTNKSGEFSQYSKSYIHINTPNRQKWYDKIKGVPLTDYHKSKVREGHLKRLNRYICQYKDGVLIKKWNSACEIQRELGFDKTHIGRCCKHKKMAYGYMWKYEKKEN